MPTTPNTPDIFDAVASGQTAPIPGQPSQQQSSQPLQSGDIFDRVASGSDGYGNPIQPAPHSDEMQFNPDDILLTKAAKGIGGTLEGVGEGVFGTMAGASDIADRMTGAQPGAANRYLHHLAGDDNTEHGTAQNIGIGSETLAEFLLGDEALKGVALSDKLLKTGRVAKLIEGSPRLEKALQIGINVLRSGLTQGGITTVKTGGDVKQGAEQGILAGGLTGTLGAAGAAVSAIRKAASVAEIQPALQSGVRSVLSTVADDAGVQASPSASIRDVAKQVGDALYVRSRLGFKALDDATGGRFQRFEDALKNINQSLRETTGLDDEAEDALLKRKSEIEQSQKDTFEQAKQKGVNPQLVDDARADWKQAHSLYDLDRQIKMAASGMRPELAASGVESSPEALDPTKLFTRLNRLYDTGRLQQGIGQTHAASLINAADNAFLAQAKIAARQKLVKTAAKTAATVVGLGTAYGIGKGASSLFDTTK